MCGCKRQIPTMFAPSSIALALICFVIAAGSPTSTRCGLTGPSRKGASFTQLSR